MGRSKSAKYQKNLKEQAHRVLVEQLRAGEGRSKNEDKAIGATGDRIYSYSTYKAYYKHCGYFTDWVKANHPECKTLKSAEKYVTTYLNERVAKGGQGGKPLSAWTIKLERQALGKLYGIKAGDDNFFKAPKRERQNITRSRGNAARDKHFSTTKNSTFITFCKSTGCRRNVIEKLEGRDLKTMDEIKTELDHLRNSGAEYTSHTRALEDAVSYFSDNQYFIHHRSDKGGRERFSPIVGDVATVVDKMQSVGANERVWSSVPTKADIHGYRSEYATAVYQSSARPLTAIPKKDVYACRKDKQGVKLDKKAMMVASKALGHNRIDVVASNYLR